MGRLGPLTSQALGRSPYDDVVEGNGEPTPGEPEKQYDERGRVVNPQTKQIIKDVIRAHNEVMLVIGVAEPENDSATQAQLAIARDHQMYETETGKTLLNLGRSLGILGIWGVHGARQRILLYKRYADVPFHDLYRAERENHSRLQLYLAGVPSFISMQVLRWCSLSLPAINERRSLRAAMAYLRFHFHVFLTMQRLDLIPSSQLLPGLRFFVPFSESSPFAAPPSPADLSIASLSSWLGKLAVNLAPYAAFYLCGRVWNFLHIQLWPHILRALPRPTQPELQAHRGLMQANAMNSTWQSIPESPTLGAGDREIRHAQTPDADVPTLMALDGQQLSGDDDTGALPVQAIRRQSTFSSRGGGGIMMEDYGSDEEDSEMVNPTLISFDVDTSDTAEPPAGVWSAELRPSFAGDARGQDQGLPPPTYLVNALTRLPSILAADILSNFAAYLLCTPMDALALRSVAHAFAAKRGIPTHHMLAGPWTSTVSMRGVVNIVGLELLRLIISGEVWAVATVVSQWLHVSEEEWKDIHHADAAAGAQVMDDDDALLDA
ncbi:uncharacterized protein B0I36DRAFT_320440 [Microdochium trichocladiopsis]|uniref:Uncharacterized protein n=1 Tax=Microdochium trichocladiopsis TaxID=1682393 RepID=A0A9P8YAU1_9PEZI|nr:uncharacterized protein B0I36DRAFT_320440 [Microdochium trichocladiopsis]KAH7032954.1 hypothetical protein B0I36DRAFT_320440 [Microdochium trichocladiopsis]